MSGDSDGKDGKTGYKHPPAHRRFQPGQSGNPRGRPKKSPSVGLEIVAELGRKVSVRENGVELKMTKSAALAKSLVSRALAGDMRAVGHLMKLLPGQFQAPESVHIGGDATLDAAEAAALERFVARRLAVGHIKADENPLDRNGGDDDA